MGMESPASLSAPGAAPWWWSPGGPTERGSREVRKSPLAAPRTATRAAGPSTARRAPAPRPTPAPPAPPSPLAGAGELLPDG